MQVRLVLGSLCNVGLVSNLQWSACPSVFQDCRSALPCPVYSSILIPEVSNLQPIGKFQPATCNCNKVSLECRNPVRDSDDCFCSQSQIAMTELPGSWSLNGSELGLWQKEVAKLCCLTVSTPGKPPSKLTKRTRLVYLLPLVTSDILLPFLPQATSVLSVGRECYFCLFLNFP